jgi:predicted transcriptional regulator
MQSELRLLGLTDNEAEVYEALVHLGPCKAGAVIARLSIHRNIVYRSLESLTANGFVTRIEKNGVWHFQIADPQSFLISTERRERVLSELVAQIGEVQDRVSSQIVVYEGVASYRNYWLESLNRFPDGTIDYVAGGELTRWSNLMGSAAPTYIKRVIKKNMSWKQLYFRKPEVEELQSLKKLSVRYETRLWKDPDPLFKGNFNVLHDTIILHTLSDRPKIIEIRDSTIVDTFLRMFNLMWAKAERVKLT